MNEDVMAAGRRVRHARRFRVEMGVPTPDLNGPEPTHHPPVGDGGLRIMAEKCSTCIFRPGNPMDLVPGRVTQMVRTIREEDSYIPCHKTLVTRGPTALCRGQLDVHVPRILRVFRDMDCVVEVTEAEVAEERRRYRRVDYEG